MAELDDVLMKNTDNKMINVVVKLLTDCLLICSLIKNQYQNLTLKKLQLIRAPLRTDKIHPVQLELENHLVLLTLR